MLSSERLAHAAQMKQAPRRADYSDGPMVRNTDALSLLGRALVSPMPLRGSPPGDSRLRPRVLRSSSWGRRRRRSLILIAILAACASSPSTRYVQFRELQANLNTRAAEALDAGLIDAATARRVLAISEAITVQARRYRVALENGERPSVMHSILDAIERLLQRADRLLPAPEVLR